MENFVQEAVCRERCRVNEERLQRDKERLTKGEEKIDSVEKAIVLLTQITEQHKEAISDHDRRLETLEHRPNMWLDKIIAGVIAAVISGAIALLFNALS